MDENNPYRITTRCQAGERGPRSHLVMAVFLLSAVSFFISMVLENAISIRITLAGAPLYDPFPPLAAGAWLVSWFFVAKRLGIFNILVPPCAVALYALGIELGQWLRQWLR